MLTEHLCKACRSFASTYPAGTCVTCGRVLPADAGMCRPCRQQASLIAGPANKTALDLSVAAVTGHQLRLHFGRLASPGGETAQEAAPAAVRPQPARSRSRWVQLLLCDMPRDLSAVSAQLPPVDAALAEMLLDEAVRLAELRGWSPRTLSLTQRGLRILAAVHGPGEAVRASTVRQLTARNMPFPHIIDVLAAIGVLDDDRPDTLAMWIDTQLAGLPAQIRVELDTWLGLLRHGGSRRRPRSRRTIVRDLYSIRGFLAGIGVRYSTLRQVTRDDITTWLAGRPGKSRPQDASTLRGLFGILKSERLIFTNPARGVRVSRRNPSVPAPLPAHLLTTTAEAARDDPAVRVAVALAGVHALLPGQIRHLRLTQVDLPGRRLDPGGIDRPLDEFTAAAIRGYLAFRDQRWPTTTSPYVLVTRKTAHTGEPVSRFWMNRLFRGLPVTAAQLRDDRIIEEAISGRADPLHLAAVFGFGPRSGLRYAQAARDTGQTGLRQGFSEVRPDHLTGLPDPPLFAFRVADRRVRTHAQIREFGTGALNHEGCGPNEGRLLRTVDCFRTRPHLGLDLVSRRRAFDWPPFGERRRRTECRCGRGWRSLRTRPATCVQLRAHGLARFT